MAQAALPLSRAEKQELIAILQGMLDADGEEVDAEALNQTLKEKKLLRSQGRQWVLQA
jgi:hypothetical protein